MFHEFPHETPQKPPKKSIPRLEHPWIHLKAPWNSPVIFWSTQTHPNAMKCIDTPMKPTSNIPECPLKSLKISGNPTDTSPNALKCLETHTEIPSHFNRLSLNSAEASENLWNPLKCLGMHWQLSSAADGRFAFAEAVLQDARLITPSVHHARGGWSTYEC